MNELKRHFAPFGVNRHLAAYQIDGDPRHIANAWLSFRHAKGSVNEKILAWVDRLAREVLKPRRVGVRPRQNTVRDLELYWQERALRDAWIARGARQLEITASGAKAGKPVDVKHIHTLLGKRHGLSASAVKVAIHRVERTLRDPGRFTRARHS